MPRPNIVTLVWAPHEARTASFAEWLRSPLYNIHYLGFKRRLYAPFKYPLQWFKTWYEMLRARPQYIYVTNSPPIAGLCVYIYCLFTKTRYVMDTHTPNLYGPKWGWTAPLQRFLARRAAMNVVDQEKVKQTFEAWQAPVMVLENPPKEIPEEWLAGREAESPIEFTYVGTFAADEPIDELLAACRQLPDIRFYILGDVELARPEWVEAAPENVTFTGYLLKEEYWGLLSRSHGIIALTTHTFSLCGAGQDGLDIQKPVILSDQQPLRLHFAKGAVFVENSAESIAAGIRTFLAEEARLNREITELSEETAARWKRNFRQLQELMRS